MKSIVAKITTNQTINKSLFINHLIPVHSEEEAMTSYRSIKKEYPDATHHCFAYITGKQQNHQKYHDDGEPNRTAGYPMLDVLLKHDVTDVLAVTVRYYGGIKLGSGGLIRAYSGSVSGSLKKATFASLTAFELCQIQIPFDEIGHVEHFLRQDHELVHTEYGDQVTYFVEIPAKKRKHLKQFIMNQTSGTNTFSVVGSWEQFV